MLRLLIDQNLDHRILRGLTSRIPQLDAVTAFEIGMSEATDPELLAWAAQAGRVIVTHDRKTMTAHTADLLTKGETTAGLLVVLPRIPLHQAITDLELMITCSDNADWFNVIRYLPL
jgi:hypothetical protein